jgi:hypothetical protein
MAVDELHSLFEELAVLPVAVTTTQRRVLLDEDPHCWHCSVTTTVLPHDTEIDLWLIPVFHDVQRVPEHTQGFHAPPKTVSHVATMTNTAPDDLKLLTGSFRVKTNGVVPPPLLPSLHENKLGRFICNAQ